MRRKLPRAIGVAWGVWTSVTVACDRQQLPRDLASGTITIMDGYGDERLLVPHANHVRQFMVFLPLVTETETGEIEGRLAERWEHSSDYREWTYHLRAGVVWEDGHPVTSHDVVSSFELLAHPDVGYLHPESIESVRAIDDSTVTVRWGTLPYGWHTWFVVYPMHLLEQLDPKEFSEWAFWTHPVGDGPYRYVRHVPKMLMEFEANPSYYGPSPPIKRVVLKFGTNARTELLAGNVDLVGGSVTDIPLFEEDERFNLYIGPLPGQFSAILWQNRHPILGDARVRRALTFAIDRVELLHVLNLPPEHVPIVDGVSSGRHTRYTPPAGPLPHDPEEAGRLLEAAGWRDSDGDGIRERDGEDLKFTALVHGGLETVAVFVKEELRAVGAEMEVQLLDYSVLLPRLQAGEFEAAFQFVSLPMFLDYLLGPGSWIGYQEEAGRELVERYDRTQVPDEQDRLLLQITELLRRDLPFTLLVPTVWVSVARRRVQGLRSGGSNPVVPVEQLWLSDEG